MIPGFLARTLLDRYSVVPCTERFEATTSNITRVIGLVAYPFGRVQRPIGGCTMPEPQVRAVVAHQQAAAILLGA
jgi:hypothetical protein